MENAGFYLVPLGIAAYYMTAWLLVGRNSQKESVVIQYHPPAELSPAAMRYLLTLHADGRTLAAILAQLSLRGLVTILPDKTTGTVSVRKLGSDLRVPEALAPEEKLVLKRLFEWDSQIQLKAPELYFMEKLTECLHARLRKYVTRNLIWIGAAILASGLAAAWMTLSLALFGTDRVESYMMGGFTGLSVAVFAAASAYIWDSNLQAVKLVFRGLYHRRVVVFLFFLIVLYPAGWYFLMRSVTPVFANVTGLMIVINMFAAPCLRNYTREGQELVNRIQGFRQFLERAEQDRLQRLNPPDQPLHSGREYLPHAIALDVREAWGDQLGIKAMVETAL